MKTGDVVVKLADEPIHSAAELVVAVRLRRPGERLPVTVRRDGDEERVTVTLDAVELAPTPSPTVPAQTISTG
jgi:putative serine protease PepD